MTPDLIFQLSNLVVLPFWLLMILAPHWRLTKRLLAEVWLVAIPAVIYAALLLPQIGGVFGELANPSLAGIAAMLGQPEAALVGWVHFLAFDLFVGRWAYLDSRQRKLTAWLASPALFFIFMAGPLGFLLYLLARWLGERLRPAAQ